MIIRGETGHCLEMDMFSAGLISLMSACFLVSILMECDVQTTPIPNHEDAIIDSTENSKTNYSDSDIDYEVYAYYLPFLKEQNVSNEKADYSYYENDYLSYYSYDKSLEDRKNRNHQPESNGELIEETDATTTDDHQNATDLKSLSKTVDGLLTTKMELTTYGLQNSSEPEKQSKMSTVRDTAYVNEGIYVVDDSFQDVTEPYSPENNGSKFLYKGIGVTESYEDVIRLDSLPIKRTDATVNHLQDAVAYGIRNETEDFGANNEQDVDNICLRPVEKGSPYSLLFPCSSFEIQPACIEVDHTIEACSEISDVDEADPRRICVKKATPPHVVACNDPFRRAFCFEGSAKDKLIPCQDDEKRVCLYQKGHLEICSSVEHETLAF